MAVMQLQNPQLGLGAIAAITILEGIALWRGVDGVLLGGALAAIAGIGGWTAGRRRKK